MGQTLSAPASANIPPRANADLLIAKLAEGNAAAHRILSDVYRVAGHEKTNYQCAATAEPLALLQMLQHYGITGLKICDIFQHLCGNSAAHLAAVLTVAAHPMHFSRACYDSATYYLGLCDASQVTPVPLRELNAEVALQLKINAGRADIHSTQIH